MTAYGINPSRCDWTSRLPLFRNLLYRAPRFEVFTAGGLPTGLDAPVGEDGWPLATEGGGRVGMRLFGDTGGTSRPSEGELQLVGFPEGTEVRSGGNGLVTVSWRGALDREARVLWAGRPGTVFFDGPSLVALAGFKPAALRTLDWSRVNDRRAGDWGKADVTEDDLQGGRGGMCLHLQARAARLLRTHLWLNVAPRMGATAEEWRARVTAQLEELGATLDRPPILELGNEPWNGRISQWSNGLQATGKGWEARLAVEVAELASVATEVLGERRSGFSGYQPWYLFVGGHVQNPESMAMLLAECQALGVEVDMAGPAVYVGPARARRDAWEASGRVPSVEELHQACLERLAEVEEKLEAHGRVVAGAGVPHLAVYEAGQAMMAGVAEWRRAGLEYQSDELCGVLYRRIREVLERRRVGLACWYSVATSQRPPAPLDPFGLLEGLGIAELPKAKAARGG